MKIIHRITMNANSDKKAIKELLKCGLKLKPVANTGIPLQTFEISEDDPIWPQVAKVVDLMRLPKLTRTEFTKKEILAADRVRVWCKNIKGYPMPDEDGSWKEVSFDINSICPTCGMGRIQNAPIRLKGAPKMGKNSFVSNFWLFELFALPEVIEVMNDAGITGFETLAPIHYKTLKDLKSVKQLKITDELQEGVLNDDLVATSPACGHDRYIGLSRGMYKYDKKAFEGKPDFVKSKEWFGARLQATQLKIVSSKFVELYYKNNWKGLVFSPIELKS